MDTESWEDRDAKVEVTRPEGFMMKVGAQEKQPDKMRDNPILRSLFHS